MWLVYRKNNLFGASNNIKKRFEDISVFLLCWRKCIFAVLTIEHNTGRAFFKQTHFQEYLVESKNRKVKY